MVKNLNNIPVVTEFETVLKKLGINEDEDIELVRGLFKTAKNIARPKVLFRESYVEEISGKKVRIDGTEFESDVLAVNLKNIHRVFAYVGTCGTEVDDWSANEKDYVVSLWLDMIKQFFLFDAIQYFRKYIKEGYKFETLSSVNPGSGNAENWPIAQQKLLFAMIGDVKKEIGVTLTDSYLMLPIKSSSGLLYQSGTEFVNCSLCGRKNCTGRRAEFNKELHEKTFG